MIIIRMLDGKPVRVELTLFRVLEDEYLRLIKKAKDLKQSITFNQDNDAGEFIPVSHTPPILEKYYKMTSEADQSQLLDVNQITVEIHDRIDPSGITETHFFITELTEEEEKALNEVISYGTA